jgi:hypothetical protein
MKSIYLIISFSILFISSCSKNTNKQEEKQTEMSEIALSDIENRNDERELAEIKENEIKILNDSLFEINPTGFIIGHSENPSWDVAYILFENGNLVFTTFPPNEDIYYKVGKWKLKNDSLKFTMTKLVFTEGTGKKIKVTPSGKYQRGEKFENYGQKSVDTLIIESFAWNDIKTLIKSEDHWEWRLEDKRAKYFSFNDFDK